MRIDSLERALIYPARRGAPVPPHTRICFATRLGLGRACDSQMCSLLAPGHQSILCRRRRRRRHPTTLKMYCAPAFGILETQPLHPIRISFAAAP